MLTNRLLLLFATLAASLGLSAATVEERSPFRQGMWWDPTRSGHGFEILANAGDDVMVVWYTYDTAGQPTWYTAQGKRGNVGTAWSLLKHRWVGARAESQSVGSLTLTINHFEKITAAWQVDGGQGTWTIEPFVESGTINEVDLTGLWYDPTNSGWGMTVVDQGDVYGAVIYGYDPNGAPTWVAGFDRGKGTRVALQRSEGPCPSCGNRFVSRAPAGSVDIVPHTGDTWATVRGAPSIALAPGLRIDGARVNQLGRAASARRGDFQLVPFATEKALRAYLVTGMEQRSSASGIDFSPAPAGASPAAFSTTNLQEEGVDEADFVKSDGRYVYAVTGGGGSPTSARKVRIAAVGEGGSSLSPVGEYGIGSTSLLYLHGGNLISVSGGSTSGIWFSPAPTAETHIEVASLANPAAPVNRYRAKLPGSAIASRRIGDTLYVVTLFTPNPPGYILYPSEAQRSANRELVSTAPMAALLPSVSENGGERVTILTPSSIYAPQYGGNRVVADMVVVYAFDLREPRLAQALAILGRAETIYVSTRAIYLASSRYDTQPSASLTLPVQRSLLNTDIHKIAVDGSLRLAGSGSVEGWVSSGMWGNSEKAAFRLGEMGQRLGVVTSTTMGGWGSNSNRVTVLEPSSIATGLLKTVSFLPNSRRPETLGKPNEALYGTRFVGNKLYAVTFQRTDPLYTVDLSNAADPRITGALEIPGFSDYLHPLPNGLLLGVGRHASDTGVVSGLNVSLFDVNGATPRELQRVTVGQTGSDSPIFGSHHALSVLRRSDGTTVLGLPAMVYDGFVGSVRSWAYSGLLRFEVRGTTAADARLAHTHTLKSDIAYGPGLFPPSYAESSSGHARSVLFPDASVYVKDAFWRQDAAGNVFGPY